MSKNVCYLGVAIDIFGVTRLRKLLEIYSMGPLPACGKSDGAFIHSQTVTDTGTKQPQRRQNLAWRKKSPAGRCTFMLFLANKTEKL